MASNLRRSRRTFSQRFLETESTTRALARRSSPTRIGSRAITSLNLAPNTVDLRNITPGLSSTISYIQASANGKNTVYRQATEPTGGNYANGDIWFDTDNDNRISRYRQDADPALSGWVAVSLGDGALSAISADKITAGTIDASIITVSNIDAGNITVGVLSGIVIQGNTIVGGTITIGSGTSIFKADTNGIYLGNSTFASAPFRVTPEGAMTATSGSIAGWTITSTEFQAGSAYINSSGAALIPTIVSDVVGGVGSPIHTGGASSIDLKTKADTTTVGFVRNISYGATKPTTANLTVGDIHFS